MTLTVIEVGGTYQLTIPAGDSPTLADPLTGLFATKIGPGSEHAALFNYKVICYPGALFPMQTSMAIADAHVRTVLAETPGKFALIGTSQGAIVCSDIYDALRGGDLNARRSDLVGAFMYGNPRRQTNLVFPGCPNPEVGSHGLDWGHLLTGCESLWWEFARPGDMICIAGDDPVALLWGDVCFMFVVRDYTGCGSLFKLLFQPQPLNLINGVVEIVMTIYLGVIGAGGHSYNDLWQPLGDGRGALTIAADRLVELAGIYG